MILSIKLAIVAMSMSMSQVKPIQFKLQDNFSINIQNKIIGCFLQHSIPNQPLSGHKKTPPATRFTEGVFVRLLGKEMLLKIITIY
jgi:hypothetical protein